ncbi:hypothetical protein Tco_0615659, partial [Tanacetum coccineum]
ELTVYDIKSFDPVLGKTLIEFEAFVERRKYLQSIGENSAVNLDPCFRDTKIEDLHLGFTLPGYSDFILGSGAGKEMVNTTNQWLYSWVTRGIQALIQENDVNVIVHHIVGVVDSWLSCLSNR